MPIKERNIAVPKIRTIKYRVKYSAFTDGGAAVGTYQFPDLYETTVPAGSFLLGSHVSVIAGFAGDTSAALTIGDGTDVDRYNTSTIDVFTTAAAGVQCGVPSGNKNIVTANRPTLTITSATDWGAVTAGEIEVSIFFMQLVA